MRCTLQELLVTTQRRLASFASDPAVYKGVLRGLIVQVRGPQRPRSRVYLAACSRPPVPPLPQGLVKLGETKVIVRCREVDVPLVQEVAPQALEEYKQTMLREAGITVKCSIAVNDKDKKHLPPPPAEGRVGPSWCAALSLLACRGSLTPRVAPPPRSAGGVILVAFKGKILCDNTLDTCVRGAARLALRVTSRGADRLQEVANRVRGAEAGGAHDAVPQGRGGRWGRGSRGRRSVALDESFR